jgi:hypothetical protein
MARFQEFLLGPVTLSFVEGLWTKQKMRGSEREPQFVVNCILDDPAAANVMQQWVDYAISQGHPGMTAAQFSEDHYALRETDKHKAYSKVFPSGTKWFRAKSNFEPTVLDMDRATVVKVNGPDNNNPGKNIFYPGVKAYIVCHLYTYTYNNRPGVQVGINQVIKFGNGEPFEERSGGDYSDLLNAMPGAPGQASSLPPNSGPPTGPGVAPPLGSAAPPAQQAAPGGPPAFNPGAAPAGGPPGAPPAGAPAGGPPGNLPPGFNPGDPPSF